jgi:hypothetical protein
MATAVTLREYEHAERVIAFEGARTGLAVHGIVTALVCVALVLINVALAPEFPWSAFAVAGMTIGLAVHWWFGYRKLDEQLDQKEIAVEAKALELR